MSTTAAKTQVNGYYSDYDISRIRSINNRMRRERQLRRRIITALIMLSVIVFLAIFLSFSFMSDAKVDDSHKQYRYYTSITVSSGDTMWSIAEANMDPLHYNNVEAYVADIASINRICTDAQLNAGSDLIIPYYSDEVK